MEGGSINITNVLKTKKKTSINNNSIVEIKWTIKTSINLMKEDKETETNETNKNQAEI